MSATVAARTAPQTMLRRILLLDAVVTGANALAYLAVSGPLGDLLGVSGGLLVGLGVFLLVYSAAVGYLGTRPEPPVFGVRLVIEANTAWAVASIAVLLLGALDPATAGLVWIPLQAATVLGFAALQYVSLRSVNRPAPATA